MEKKFDHLHHFDLNNMEAMASVPIYPDVKHYANVLGDMHIWEADGWKEESMSWKESCYIHSGLTGLTERTCKGPDAQKLLSYCSINNCEKWPIHKSKHLVMCDKDGYVALHGLFVRDAEDSFRVFASGLPWEAYISSKMGFDVQFSTREIFIHQIAGPKALEVIQKVVNEDLRDLKFLEVRKVTIPGIDAELEASRVGMVGTLAYELRGPYDVGAYVYDAVYEAGKPLGMKRLGWRTYLVNHAEGGFPQSNCTFSSSCILDKGFMEFCQMDYHPPLTGSAAPDDMKARLRTPGDVGWLWMAKFDHDFLGREAVEAEAKNPRRTIVTLEWNADDVVDIYRSLLEPGEEYKTMELPCCTEQPAAGHADYIMKDGKQVGVSSGVTYSYYYRKVISHASINIDESEIGNEVIVYWGDYGKRIKPVRATVARYPYLEMTRNQDYDVSHT